MLSDGPASSDVKVGAQGRCRTRYLVLIAMLSTQIESGTFLEFSLLRLPSYALLVILDPQVHNGMRWLPTGHLFTRPSLAWL